MKAITCLATFILAAGALFAYAQSSQSNGQQVIAPPSSSGSYLAYPYGYQGASTPGESYARGMSDIIRAQGDYNLSTSAAAVNMGEARRREIDNAKHWTQTYFDMREINRQQFLAEQQRKRGSLDHSSHAKLARLSPSELDTVTGEIHWPVLLTAQEYAEQRGAVQKAFAARADNGAMRAEDLLNVNHTADEMLGDLKSHVRELPADKYMSAKRFLETLSSEAGQPMG